ncbi:E3 SUMO-protein ligase ZBED1-like [Cyprinodon tularosa]|uniref:E3 SUMO-protein ligase ZBED1-like n=1 Tax=Cyprinodon tularosa TaxID=77115 RepID=UPI0018E1FEF6|nr:E3 SUMO-protein ligase ZBED1-like [Cyprinodon tularosa]
MTYNPPSRNTIMSKIQQLYDSERNPKGDVLVGAEHIALTGDHWTSVSNHNYLGVTAHIIDCEWKLQSFALAMLKTEARHHADNCTQQFLTVAEAWGVQPRITTVGTDSARNMIAAARKLPYQHMPCVAHMLHRSISVCLTDSGFCDTLAKCRKIVGHFKHSPANTEELHQQQTQLGQVNQSLIQDVSTRWNSSLAMISRLLENQEAIKATLSRQKHKLTMLKTSEWDKLQRLKTVLEPCSYVSCSVVLPALCHLYRTMEVSDEDPAYIGKFKTAFKKDLSERQANLNNGWLNIASALDPRFKDLKCLKKGDREAVWTSLQALLENKTSTATLEPVEEPPKKRSLLLFASDTDSDDDMVEPSRALKNYKAEPTISMEECPLQWWKTHAGAHQQLSVVARKYLAAPATSVPCERLFSLAGNIVQKKRAALSSENVEKLVCLSDWLKEK